MSPGQRAAAALQQRRNGVASSAALRIPWLPPPFSSVGDGESESSPPPRVDREVEGSPKHRPSHQTTPLPTPPKLVRSVAIGVPDDQDAVAEALVGLVDAVANDSD